LQSGNSSQVSGQLHRKPKILGLKSKPAAMFISSLIPQWRSTPASKLESGTTNIEYRVYVHRPPTDDRRFSVVVGLPSVVDILRFSFELLSVIQKY
jgi:hypothetical protein